MNEDAKLHESAQRLGARAAERLDVEATARAVVERLRREPAARPAWLPPAWLRMAAALLLVAGGAAVARQMLVRPDAGGHAAAHFVTDDLTDLSAEQLREVLSTLDETLTVGGTTLPQADLEDLNAQQLRAVLRSLEG